MTTKTAYSDIADLGVYNSRMSKGIMDKLFFVDKIDPDVIVDFGSADGLLIEHLLPWFPEAHFIGYDHSPKMVTAGQARLADHKRVWFTDDWEKVETENTLRQAVVLSSIIHEVYHYQEPHEVDAFWQQIFESGFQFIVLRDMIPSRSVDRSADINDVSRVYRKFLHTPQLQDFENIWGSIEGNRNLTHFLLKYKYRTPNWDREVKENYLPLYREDLLAMVPENYHVVYHEHYVLPYIKRMVRDELGIELKDPTHLKIILERTP